MRAALRPEHQLLWACARSPEGEAADGRIRRLAESGLDWDYVCRAAHAHGILSLVNRRLSAFPESIAPPLLACLREGARTQVIENLTLTSELLSILGALQGCGVPAVPFKGPALAAHLYGDLATRGFGDLDLLVKAGDVKRACAAIEALGYRLDIALADIDALLLYGCEVTLRRGAVTVELHWRLAPEFFSVDFRFESLFERLTTRRLDRHDVPALADADLLFALSVHGAKDAWQRLIWLVDVARLAQVADIDWPKFLSSATALGCRRLVLAPICAAREMLGLEPSPTVADAIAEDPSVTLLAGDIQASVFRDSLTRMSGLSECRFHLKSRERIADKLRYCARLMLTPTLEDDRYVRLPDELSALRRIVRPVRLLAKYAGVS